MDYEVVNLDEKMAVGIGERTGNRDPQMEEVIGGLWNRFYNEGIYESIPNKANSKTLGMYTDYAGNEMEEYKAMVACEVLSEPEKGNYDIWKIPSGPYAKFIVKGSVVQAVAKAWEEIGQMNLSRTFSYDFEEYQDDNMENGDIHIYVGLKEE